MGRHGFRLKDGVLNKLFTRKQYFENEASALKKLAPHPFITEMIESVYQETVSGKFYGIIKMKHIVGCDLFSWHETYSEGSSVEFCRYVCKSILIAYDYALKNSIYHRDIKLENIMIDANGVVKLIDWELASFKKYSRRRVGTVEFMAGEIHLDKSYICEKSDVWSLAVTIFMLYFGTRPYKTVLPTFLDDGIPFYGEWLTMIYDRNWKAYWRQTRTNHNHVKTYDRYITKFIEKTLLKEPGSRPSIQMLISDDLFIGPCMKRVDVVKLMGNVEHDSPL